MADGHLKTADDVAWDRVKERHEAFWTGDAALVHIRAPNPEIHASCPDDVRPTEPDDLFEWYTSPERVVPRLDRERTRSLYGGDAFPTAFPVATSLVAIQAGYLGGDYAISPANGSAWCDPVIADWPTRKPLRVRGVYLFQPPPTCSMGPWSILEH